MNAAPTNINTTTPINTYLCWAKTGSFNGSAPVINAQNPDRERSTKEDTGAIQLPAQKQWS